MKSDEDFYEERLEELEAALNAIRAEARRNISNLSGSARRGDESMCTNWVYVRDLAQTVLSHVEPPATQGADDDRE